MEKISKPTLSQHKTGLTLIVITMSMSGLLAVFEQFSKKKDIHAAGLPKNELQTISTNSLLARRKGVALDRQRVSLNRDTDPIHQDNTRDSLMNILRTIDTELEQRRPKLESIPTRHDIPLPIKQEEFIYQIQEIDCYSTQKRAKKH